MKYNHPLSHILPKDRSRSDYLNRLAWGTDAGFYRMIPQLILFPETEEEVMRIMKKASEKHVAVTFRAAGTSLSGQSISDSVLLVAAKKWEGYRISDNGRTIFLQPGIVGEQVNRILRPLGRKFAPDPASVTSAMIGGIMANNSSGMNCGTHANSHEVLKSARIIFTDGTLLDTADKNSRDAFCRTHPDFLLRVIRLRDQVMAQPELVERIRYKYSIKNVTGLNLLPLIRFEDPFDIIAHLMVGSEGTLAFLAGVTVSTAPIFAHRASAMMYFRSVKEACRVVQRLKTLPVIGVELLDRKALRSVESRKGIPGVIKSFPDGITALLVETAADTVEELNANIGTVLESIRDFTPWLPISFTDKESEYSVFWNIRAGIFPSIGAMRPAGSTCIIEDVAFHLKDLPEATAALQMVLEKHGYTDAAIYGHALEGNFHFILNQSFDSQKEIVRYEALMNDVITLVVDTYDGSLKAEHGTGRNMAPFVRKEWGESAFQVMKQIKALFDPDNILNPGVIFNDDPQCHIKGFKPLPLLHPVVDKCIECGFCEPNCLTSGKTLSSRQRIIVQREILRLKKTGESPALLKALEKDYFYPGRATCAGDGLCSISCPMEINTGHLTHYLREKAHPKGSGDWYAGKLSADHFQGLKKIMRAVLWAANAAHTVAGTSVMYAACRLAHKMGFPLWTPSMPRPHTVKIKDSASATDRKVVYFPSCINQSMGVAKGAPNNTPLTEKMTGLLQKAGYEVIFPDNMDKLCCGTIWESKGMPDIADAKTAELNGALWIASRGGKYPVLCDQSPCLYRMREKITGLKLYEPVEFIEEFLVPRLDFHPVSQAVALHITCTTRKMHLDDQMRQLAERCSTRVFIPEEVGCCGFAGDKGFTRPEINAYALRKLKPQLEASHITIGYSNSRTCEIGLTTHGGIPYMSIAYLVDACTTPKQMPKMGQK